LGCFLHAFSPWQNSLLIRFHAINRERIINQPAIWDLIETRSAAFNAGTKTKSPEARRSQASGPLVELDLLLYFQEDDGECVERHRFDQHQA
jgi:hypothetical protein